MRFTKRLSNTNKVSRKPVQRSRQLPLENEKKNQEIVKKEKEILYENPMFSRRSSQVNIDRKSGVGVGVGVVRKGNLENNIKFNVEYESDNENENDANSVGYNSTTSTNDDTMNSLCNKILSINLPRIHSNIDSSSVDVSNSWGVLHNFDDVQSILKDDTNRVLSYLGLDISDKGSIRKANTTDDIIRDIDILNNVDKSLLYGARNALTHLDEKSMVFWCIRHLSHFFRKSQITQISIVAIDYTLRTLKPRVWNLWRDNKDNYEVYNKIEELYQLSKQLEMDITIGVIKDDVSYIQSSVDKGYILSQTSPSRLILTPILNDEDDIDVHTFGNSELHMACANHSKKVIKYLNDTEPRLKNHTNLYGYDAITYVAEKSQTQHEKIVNKHYFSRDDDREIDDIKQLIE